MTTRRIGLSLGADLCWPMCYEEIVRRLKLKVKVDGEDVDLDVERVSIEPYDLHKPCPYDVVLDRVTHWYTTSREWIKKSILMDDLYVLNNPWSIQSMEKQTSYAAMMRLGLKVPRTWMVPPKAYDPSLTDLQTTLDRYAKLFDLKEVGDDLGYPLFMKPYDGGAWVGVNKIDDEKDLRETYEKSGTRLMHLQEAILPYELFIRCVGVGPQIRAISYDPDAPLHARYEVRKDFITPAELSELEDMTLTINSFFGWDFNSCEALKRGGDFHPIDFANACPDSQVTSLHYHFPWLVKAVIKWTIFCAVTKRPMRKTVDWEPYYAIADLEDMSYRERLASYAEVGRKRLDVDRFNEFCDTHLSHLDGIAWEFFGSDTARGAVRAKVESLFPADEVDHFTDWFWERVQLWRTDEAERLGRPQPQVTL